MVGSAGNSGYAGLQFCMGTQSSIHDLRMFVLSHHPLIVVPTLEEDRLDGICQSVAQQTRSAFYEWTVTSGLRRLDEPRSLPGTQDPQKLLQEIQRGTNGGVYVLKDFAPYLETAPIVRSFKEICQLFEKTRSTLILTGSSVEIPNDLRDLAIFYDLHLPNEEEVRNTLKSVLGSLRSRHSISIDIDEVEARNMVRMLKGMPLKQIRQMVTHAVMIDSKLSSTTLSRIAEQKAKTISATGLLDFYPLEELRVDLGGFENLKAWLERAKMGFSEKAKALNLTPPKGILLVGVPGSGKSLAAKYISKSWGLPLLKLDMSRLFDKYIGETEKNFRKATQMAESLSPIVLWMDEIEKAIQSGGGETGDSGIGSRLFGNLLTWLQEKKSDVFVVATANDLSRLPPELLRKGRFDEIFFVDLATTSERAKIFDIHLRIRKQNPDSFRISDLVAASEGFTGAEIEQAVIASFYRALHEDRAPTPEDILKEVSATVPLSVSRAEDIESLRRFAQGRFVPVSQN